MQMMHDLLAQTPRNWSLSRQIPDAPAILYQTSRRICDTEPLVGTGRWHCVRAAIVLLTVFPLMDNALPDIFSGQSELINVRLLWVLRLQWVLQDELTFSKFLCSINLINTSRQHNHPVRWSCSNGNCNWHVCCWVSLRSCPFQLDWFIRQNTRSILPLMITLRYCTWPWPPWRLWALWWHYTDGITGQVGCFGKYLEQFYHDSVPGSSLVKALFATKKRNDNWKKRNNHDVCCNSQQQQDAVNQRRDRYPWPTRDHHQTVTVRWCNSWSRKQVPCVSLRVTLVYNCESHLSSPSPKQLWCFLKK